MKLSDIKKAQKDIQDFCDKLGTVVTITNAKGIWTARMTKRAVQIFLVTGESLLDVYMKSSETCETKRKSLGV